MDMVKVMPCLDIKNGKVVKGVNFVDIRDAGDPVENAVYYEREGADELAFLDIAATLENRKTRLDWVYQVASVIKIPLTVGGGISSLDDIELTLKAGASKVSINTAAVMNPELIKDAAKVFGSERITVAIDVMRNKGFRSGFEVVVSGGKKPAGKDAIEWAIACEGLGAGLLLPTSIDSDGTLKGYDLELLKAITDAVAIPVVASGGAGALEHFYDGAVKGKARILLAASVFHFRTFTVKQVKKYLRDRGVNVRVEEE